MSSYTLIRHATALVRLAEQGLLVDPLLGDKDAYEPVEGTLNPKAWPLVPLPMAAEDVVSGATAVLITHTHVDHLDDVAIALVSAAGIPVFCQPPDVAELRERGLGDVRPVPDRTEWRGVVIARTEGRHGTGETADLMGPVSGFVVADGVTSVYIAGDTVWCPDVAQAIEEHRPAVVVVNSGEARMVHGDPITMSAADVIAVAKAHPAGIVVAVHLEALNHCGLTREELRRITSSAGERVCIPDDGESIQLDALTRAPC